MAGVCHSEKLLHGLWQFHHAYLTHPHELITSKENYMGNIMGYQITQ